MLYLKTFETCLAISIGVVDLLTDIDMWLIIENGIRRGICYAIHRYVKGNKKYKKYYDKNKDSSYLKYWALNILYGWLISQKLPVNDFKWVKFISEFDGSFIKSYNKESDEGYFFEVDIH